MAMAWAWRYDSHQAIWLNSTLSPYLGGPKQRHITIGSDGAPLPGMIGLRGLSRRPAAERPETPASRGFLPLAQREANLQKKKG